MNFPVLPNWLESIIVGFVVQILAAILAYLQGGTPFTWTGFGAAVTAAVLSYVTSAQWAKYIPTQFQPPAITPAAPVVVAPTVITTTPAADGDNEAERNA